MTHLTESVLTIIAAGLLAALTSCKEAERRQPDYVDNIVHHIPHPHEER